MFPTIYFGGGTGRFTPDTFIRVYVDGSVSMASEFAAINSAITTLLKPELLPYFNNDSGWYDSHVDAVQTNNSNDPGERGLRYLGYVGGSAPGGDNHVIIWISDESTPYGADDAGTFDPFAARTATYNTDLATLRNYIDANPAGYYKGGLIVLSEFPDYPEFVQTILAGTGSYAGTNGLSDKASSFRTVYGVTNGSSAETYKNHIKSILNQHGFVW